MEGLYSSVDTIWVLLGAVLVFFMQAGFAMVETGFTRAKNAGNIIMKNLMDFSLGTPVFWFIGFGLMFGTTAAGESLPFIGVPDLFVRGDYSSSFPTYAFLIFQTVFCATAATIVSGAMAERTKFISYCIYSMVIPRLRRFDRGPYGRRYRRLGRCQDARTPYRQIWCGRQASGYSRPQSDPWRVGRVHSLVLLVRFQRWFHRIDDR